MIAGTKHRGVDSPRAGSYLGPMDTPDKIPTHVRNAFAARPLIHYHILVADSKTYGSTCVQGTF
jgi:hypothetical protein